MSAETMLHSLRCRYHETPVQLRSESYFIYRGIIGRSRTLKNRNRTAKRSEKSVIQSFRLFAGRDAWMRRISSLVLNSCVRGNGRAIPISRGAR